jgi:4-hydroxybenzoate polyprenyltransferase
MVFYGMLISWVRTMIREYLKLSRSFNAVLTGISPVMGAIAMEQYNIGFLVLLFLVGFLGHSFGFVFNDIIDYKLDKTSKEIQDRPLISGTISLRNAWIYALGCMITAFVIGFFIAMMTSFYFPLIILAGSAFFITLYDLISKKLPFMDILVAIGVFFLILYGALYGYNNGLLATGLADVTLLAWIVCVLGSIQVLFMQMIAGGMKDIKNDFEKGARTTAIKMGVRIMEGRLQVSLSFNILAYTIQLVDIGTVFLPFIIVWNINTISWLQYGQWALLFIISIAMLYLSHGLLSMKQFERRKARMYIGTHYMTNFMLVPVMLMTLNPWAGILMFFPFLGFILNNLVLHGTILQPKTM